MGGLLAEKLCQQGILVTLVTPAAAVSTFTHNTLEQHRIQKSLLEMGVDVIASHTLASVSDGGVRLACTYTDGEREVAVASVVLVTAMLPEISLMQELQEKRGQWADAGVTQIEHIGDALAPGTIAAAVWSGHRYARDMGELLVEGVPFKRDIIVGYGNNSPS